MARWTEVAATIIRATFAREELPASPPEPSPPPRPARGALSLLLAPEPLPEDPPLPPRAGGRWLRWLFAPERLDE
jgi:hypothetical protein